MNTPIVISELDMPELLPYTGLSEVQLLHYYEPAPGLFVAESAKVVGRALDAGYEPVSALFDSAELTDPGSPASGILARLPEIPVYMAEHSALCRLTGFHLTGGVLCAFRRRELPSAEILCKDCRRIAVLERVMNPTNIGAIFRSAAALGMDAVLLTDGCSDPLYRRASRVSMGTVFQVPWTFLPGGTAAESMDLLHRMGFRTAAMALRRDSVNIDDPALMAEEKLAVLLGTEGDGLADLSISGSDYTVCIPMMHGVDSLNVAAASAVAFWQLGHGKE